MEYGNSHFNSRKISDKIFSDSLSNFLKTFFYTFPYSIPIFIKNPYKTRILKNENGNNGNDFFVCPLVRVCYTFNLRQRQRRRQRQDCQVERSRYCNTSRYVPRPGRTEFQYRPFF